MSERQEGEVCFQGKHSQSCSKVQLDVLTKATDTFKNENKTQTALFPSLLKTKIDHFQDSHCNSQQDCLLNRLIAVHILVFGWRAAFHSLPSLRFIFSPHLEDIVFPLLYRERKGERETSM